MLFAAFLFFLFLRTVYLVILDLDTGFHSNALFSRIKQQHTQLVIVNTSSIEHTRKDTVGASEIAPLEAEIGGENSAVYLLHCKNQVSKLHGARWAIQRLLAYIRLSNAYGPLSTQLRLKELNISDKQELVNFAKNTPHVLAFILSSQRAGIVCLSRADQDTFKEHQIVRISQNGEVFNNGYKYNCNFVDIVIDRSKSRTDSNQNRPCVGAHALQGMSYTSLPHDTYKLEKLCEKRDLAWLEAVTAGPPRRTAIVSVSRLIKRSKHSFQALVRAAFFALLQQRLTNATFDATPGLLKEIGIHRPYQSVKCPGGPLDTIECKKNYKFSIDMENSAVTGYVSEKIFTGLLANTVPVYFGAPDIAEYINPDRIVICSISKERLRELAKHKRDKTFVFGNTIMREDAYNASLLFDLVVDTLREDLAECLDETVELYHNEAKYLRKLIQNPFTHQRQVCTPNGVEGPIGQNFYDAVETVFARKNLTSPRKFWKALRWQSQDS